MNDYWSTPHAVFDILDAEFKFSIDVCATPDNARVKKFITEEQDALDPKTKWITPFQLVAWCNPPYSNIKPWVEKAIFECQRNEHSTVVMLLPCDPSAEWFALCASKAAEIRLLQGGYEGDKWRGGRIQFDPPEGTKRSSNNKPSMIAVFEEPGLDLPVNIWSWDWRNDNILRY